MTSLHVDGSQTPAAPQPNTSPNGTEPVGRPWVQAWTRTSGLWRQRAVIYMLEVSSPTPEESKPIISPSGTEPIGRDWAPGWTIEWFRWWPLLATFMRAASSP